MIRQLLFGAVVSASNRNDDKHSASSRYKFSSVGSGRSHLDNLNPNRSTGTTSTQPSTTRHDTQVPTHSNMSLRPSQWKNRVKEPNEADRHESGGTELNRDYTLVETDQTDEQGYDVIPNVETSIVEINPPRPPHALDYYAEDRSYLLQLAERMGFWLSDPVARLGGGKQRGPDKRDDKEKAAQQEVDDKAWVDNIKNDIQCLWNNMGIGQDLLGDELQVFREAFFSESRAKLEKVEKEDKGVSLDQFQQSVRTLLVLMDLKLSEEGLKILKEMATDKQVLKNEHSFSFEEQRAVGQLARKMMSSTSEERCEAIRQEKLSDMSKIQREMFERKKLDPVKRHFNNLAVKKFAQDKKEAMEAKLKKSKMY